MCSSGTERDFNPFQACALIARRDWRSLLLQVFEAQPNGIFSVRERFGERFTLGHDSWKSGNQSRKPTIGIRLQDNGVRT
jgi:hypothetical protein